MGKHIGPSTDHRTSTSARSEALADFLPPDWPQDIPLARIVTCGCSPLSIEVLQRVDQGQPIYAPPDPTLWKSLASKTVLTLLAVLASQPGCTASQDFLAQALRPGRLTTSPAESEVEEIEEEDRALKRPENVVTLLRRLLYPPVLLHLSEIDQRTVRNLLIRRLKASSDSGPAYQLASLPLIWLDVEVMELHSKQIKLLEQFGEDAQSEWQAISEMAFQGTFLLHEPYSDWAVWRRAHVRELLWQSVNAQLKAISQWEDQEAGEEASLRLLAACWQAQPENEDAFRALAELLGKSERFQQVEEYYTQLCRALEREGRVPHERTEKVMDFARAKQIQRKTVAQPILPIPARNMWSGHSMHSLIVPLLLPTSLTDPGALLLSTRQAEMEQLIFPAQLFSADGLETPFLELQHKIGAALSGPSETISYVQLSRRDALLTMAVMAIPILTASRKSPAQAHVEDILTACKNGIAACWKLSHESDLLVAYETLSHYLPPLIQLTQNAPTHRKTAAFLAAQAFLLKAITGRHVANLYLAELACKEAVTYSQVAEDALLSVIALRHLAMIYYYGKRHREELAIYERIKPFLASEEIPPIVRSFIYTGLAGTQALYQQWESLNSLELARKSFAEQPAMLPPPPFIDYDYSQLYLSEGLAYYDLREYKQALNAFLQVENAPFVLAERGKLEFLNCQALTILHLSPTERDMQQCLAYWKAGIVGAINLKSRQRFEEACRTYELMQAVWPAEKQVRALQEITLLWGSEEDLVL